MITYDLYILGITYTVSEEGSSWEAISELGDEYSGTGSAEAGITLQVEGERGERERQFLNNY